MQDWRALANSASLQSYRDWEREGYRRSGFYLCLIVNPALAPVLSFAFLVTRHAARDARGWWVLAAAMFIVYLVASLGVAVFAALRLRRWRRIHPWTPPASGASRALHRPPSRV
jgi:hypothetical protein